MHALAHRNMCHKFFSLREGTLHIRDTFLVGTTPTFSCSLVSRHFSERGLGTRLHSLVFYFITFMTGSIS